MEQMTGLGVTRYPEPGKGWGSCLVLHTRSFLSPQALVTREVDLLPCLSAKAILAPWLCPHLSQPLSGPRPPEKTALSSSQPRYMGRASVLVRPSWSLLLQPRLSANGKLDSRATFNYENLFLLPHSKSLLMCLCAHTNLVTHH